MKEDKCPAKDSAVPCPFRDKGWFTKMSDLTFADGIEHIEGERLTPTGEKVTVSHKERFIAIRITGKTLKAIERFTEKMNTATGEDAPISFYARQIYAPTIRDATERLKPLLRTALNRIIDQGRDAEEKGGEQ